MLVLMQRDQRDSVNGGRTQQDFLAGQVYDVPAEVAKRWLSEQLAKEPALPAPRAPHAHDGKKE